MYLFSGGSIDPKKVAMMKKKWQQNPDFIIVRGRRNLDQQVIVQAGLKLNVVYTTNTKVLCLWYEG